MIKDFFISFFSAIFFLFVLDAAWLKIMFDQFYLPSMRHLLGGDILITPAIIFYVIYAFALTVLIVIPATQEQRGLFVLFFQGALFGLAAYGTYNLTNLATLKEWPVSLTIVDMAWGSFLSGIVTVATAWMHRLLNP